MRSAALLVLVLTALWFHFRPAPSPTARPPRWHDAVFQVPTDRHVPYFDLVTYRTALETGFRYHAGWTVQSGDGVDRSPAVTWTVDARSFALTFRVEAERVRAEATGPAGRATLRSWPVHPKVDPVRAVSDALDDLPAAAKLLGLPFAPLPAGPPSTGAVPAAGGIDDLADSLLSIRQDPTASQLARAARALAWQALLDARLAPALAPQRAAQALALAEIAERRGVTPSARELVAVARWLAPPAALGDFWVLAQGGPPANAPELSPLSASYVIYDLPRERPASWNLPYLVAFVERAVALDAAYAVPRLLTWSAGSRISGLAARYVAMTGELGAVSRHALRCLRGPIADARRTRVPGLPPVPDELAELITGTTPADPLPELVSVDWGRLIAYARSILDAAARAPSWPERVLLEEAGEQLLQGLVPVVDVMNHHRWTRPLKALADELSEATFDHPVIAQLREQLSSDDLRERDARVSQLARFPGVSARRPWGRRRGDGVRARVHARAALALWGAFPAVAFRAAQHEADDGHAHEGAVLADWLLRAHGPRSPFAGDTIPFRDRERGWRAERLPVEARRAPPIAARVAARLRERGEVQQARRVLADALGYEPAGEHAVLELVRLESAAGDVNAAREAVRAMVVAQPAGIAWARAQRELADRTLVLDRKTALIAARAASSSMDEGLITHHARIAAALGAEDDLESALGRLHLAEADPHRERLYRAAASAMATAHRARGVPLSADVWDGLGGTSVPPDDRLVEMMTRVLDRLGVNLPEHDVSPHRTAVRMAMHRPRARVTVADVRAAMRLLPPVIEMRAPLRQEWTGFVGRLLDEPDSDALSDDELRQMFGAVESLRGYAAHDLLARMEDRGVSAFRIALAANRFARLVPPADAPSLAWLGGAPGRAPQAGSDALLAPYSLRAARPGAPR